VFSFSFFLPKLQLLRKEGVAWSAQRIPTAVNLGFLDTEPLLFHSSSSSFILTRLSGPRSRLTSPTSSGRSVGIVCLRTKATEFGSVSFSQNLKGPIPCVRSPFLADCELCCLYRPENRLFSLVSDLIFPLSQSSKQGLSHSVCMRIRGCRDGKRSNPYILNFLNRMLIHIRVIL
jgi:hypothetical protein